MITAASGRLELDSWLEHRIGRFFTQKEWNSVVRPSPDRGLEINRSNGRPDWQINIVHATHRLARQLLGKSSRPHRLGQLLRSSAIIIIVPAATNVH